MRFFKSHLDWWDSDWIWRFWSNCEKWSNLLCICWDFIIGEKHYTLDHALHIRLNCLNSFSFLANYTTVPIYWSFWKFDVCLPIQDLFFWQCFSNSTWHNPTRHSSGCPVSVKFFFNCALITFRFWVIKRPHMILLKIRCLPTYTGSFFLTVFFEFVNSTWHAGMVYKTQK